jgi:putative glutamine amidotransferase
MSKKVTIGITDCSKFPNYENWIAQDPNTEVIKLSPQTNNLSDLSRCDGLILSGGDDVHPRFYKKPEYLDYCHEIDERRDEFEWKVLEYSQKNSVPLLGICRGLQIANVFFGGTLIPDIPSFGKFNHSKFPEKDRRHIIEVDPYSELKSIVGETRGEVNSAHHQSTDLVGKGLVANSISPDGIVEGMEFADKKDKPYLMLVQWHPERMTDQQNPFAIRIKESFLTATRNK